MAGGGSFKWSKDGKRNLRIGVGYGFRNALLYGEDRIKDDTPVRGGHRSFLTGSHLGGPLGIADVPGTKRAKATVGGTLRRSVHSVVFVGGTPIAARMSDDNQQPIPAYPRTGSEVVAWIGTNSGYGEWVDQGTSKMPARPFILQGVNKMAAAFSGLFNAGASAYWRSIR